MNEEVKNIENTTETVEETTAETVAAEDKSNQAEKTFTQAEVDELIQKRIAREVKKYEKKLNQPSQEQISLEDENTNLKNTITSLNKQIINFEAGKIASSLNVKSERLDAFLRLADLSEIELDDKGVYKDEIKEKIESLAAEYPEFIKDEKKEEKGFIKVGTVPTQLDQTEILRKQIEKGMGL